MSYIVIRGHIEVDQQAAASDQLSPETNLACLWNVAIRSLAYCWGWDKDDEREVSIPVREPPSLAANED